MEVIESVLFTGAGFIIYSLFFSCFLPIKKSLSKSKILFYSLLIILFWTVIELFWIYLESIITNNKYGYVYVGINVFLTIMMITAVSSIFSGKAYKKLVLICLNYLFLSISEAVYIGLYGTVLGFESLVPTILGIYPWIGPDLLNLIIILVVKQNRRKGLFLKPNFLNLQTLLFLLTIINFGLNLIELTITSQVDMKESGSSIVMTILYGVLLMSFYILFEFVNNLQKKNQQIKLNEQRYSLLEDYYKEIDIHQNEIRKIKHDMNNQLVTMKGQLHGNDLSILKKNIEEILHRSDDLND